MADRLEWVKEKVTHSLNVNEKDFSSLLEQQAPEGKSYYEELMAFFDRDSTEASVVLFYTQETLEEAGACLPKFGPERGVWGPAGGNWGMVGEGKGVSWGGCRCDARSVRRCSANMG